MSNMALIEYVGKQRNRPDDVLRTARMWKGAGDVVEVPEDQKHFYLAHPLEWRETTAAAVKKREDARLTAEKNLKDIKLSWGELTVADLDGIRDDINTEILARKKRAAAVPAAPPKDITDKAANAPPLHAGSDGASKQAAANRLIQIREAIKELDTNDPEHYTAEPNKRPRVNAVTEAVGFKVTLEEIEQALELK